MSIQVWTTVADVPNIEFWVAAAAAGPVLFIPVSFLALRQIGTPRLQRGAGLWDAQLLLLATVFALVRLSIASNDWGRGEGFAQLAEIILLALPMTDITDFLGRQRRAVRNKQSDQGNLGDGIELDDSGGPA